MNSELLQALGTIAQFAGIGGIAVFAFLVLFRELIVKPGIFPQLPQAEAYKIIRLFMILTFMVTLVGIGAWVFPTSPDNNKVVTNGYDKCIEDARRNSRTPAEAEAAFRVCHERFPN
jgi:hypothetical protein